MRRIGLVVVVMSVAAAAVAQDAVKVVKQAEPKALIVEVMVPATQAEVWKAFTTSEGLSMWLTPGAVVDLREGGEWTAHYPGGHTGGGTIVSFVPMREMTLRAMAPERLAARYPEPGSYLTAYEKAANEAVAAGVLRQHDADEGLERAKSAGMP